MGRFSVPQHRCELFHYRQMKVTKVKHKQERLNKKLHKRLGGNDTRAEVSQPKLMYVHVLLYNNKHNKNVITFHFVPWSDACTSC